MRTPVVLLTGVDPDPMAAALVGLQFDLPRAVAVRHHVDVAREVLTRVVSDVTGELERVEVDLAHACVACAVREDVVPTLERLARTGRWESVVAHLPVGASAAQVCAVLDEGAQDPRAARRLRVAAVVTALDGPGLVDDLLGDVLLAELGRETSPEDHRGIGETACGLVERADVVALAGPAEARGPSLVRALARPDARLVAGTEHLDGAGLLEGWHDHARTRAWSAATRSDELPPVPPSTWRVDLRSVRPFHPARVLDGLGSLAGGRHRSRGCFWLPSRSGRALTWDGAGGQLSIGNGEPWGRREPFTRLVLTGVGAAPDHLWRAFEGMLLDPDEAGPASPVWSPVTDGFEPWLGPVREVA